MNKELRAALSNDLGEMMIRIRELEVDGEMKGAALQAMIRKMEKKQSKDGDFNEAAPDAFSHEDE